MLYLPQVTFRLLNPEIKKENAVRIPKYELIYNGNSNEQLEISRIFSENMKIVKS